MSNISTIRIIFSISLFLLFSCNIYTQDFLWVEQAGGIGDEHGNGIAIDIDGNSYVTGFFNGIATFGSTVLTSFGGRDIFIAKYDTDGNVLWAKHAGGATLDHGSGISVDAGGNCYITGRFTGTATFGSIVLTSNGDADVFVAKYDTDGNALWAEKGGGSGLDAGFRISVDAGGNSSVTGFFNGTATFGSTVLTSFGGRDIFIAKYDTDGNVLWAEQAGEPADGDNGDGISVDTSGNTFVSGRVGSSSVFVAKYDVSGNVLWTKYPGSAGDAIGYGIAADASGNCYVTGMFWDTITFGSTVLTSNGNEDVFVAKYDTDGNALWAKNAGGVDLDWGLEIASDESGTCYVIGGFKNTATFGSYNLTSYGNQDIFIAKYDTDGNVIWAINAGGVDLDWGLGIATDESGICYATGGFKNTATFGSYNLTSFGDEDIFITRIFNGIIPVELVSLSASVLVNDVILSWSTATEINNQMFEIERKNKEGQFITIGNVEGYGTTTEPQEYSYIDNTVGTGIYYYRLKQIDFGGQYEYSDEIEIEVNGPLTFGIEQNYPNPFNPSTLIKYSISENGFVKLSVYNLVGEEVTVLVNKEVDAGFYEIEFDATTLPSGIYFYRIQAGSFVETKKMVLLR